MTKSTFETFGHFFTQTLVYLQIFIHISLNI